MGIDKEKILDLAQKYVLKGQSKKAIKEYLKLLESSPQDKRLRLKLGDLYLKNGEEDKAIQEYLQVANLYGEEDLNFRAISIYKKILSINPKSIEALQQTAKLYLKEGLVGNAKTYYQSILEIDPQHSETLKALQSLEGSKPSREEPPLSFTAESLASPPSPSPGKRTATETSPMISSSDLESQTLSPQPETSPLDKDSEMHYHLGIAYKEMELFDYAISEFELASSSPSLKFDCLMMLGNCYMEKGDYKKSIECYKKSSEIQGLSKEKMARLHFHLGLAYEACGMVSEAIHTFNTVLKLDQSFAEAQEKIRKLQPQQK